MKSVLVVLYSQTGQMDKIVKSFIHELEKHPEVEISYEVLQPDPPFPFPWNAEQFFQVFPESVKAIPCQLKPFKFKPDNHYDLIVVAYQPWYLSPSVPFHAFFQHEDTKKLINGKPVLTIIGCRNMWVMAQEVIRNYISLCGGIYAGNIVLRDKAPNLLSVISIVRWMFKNKKRGYLGIIPPAGVSEKDIRKAERFGIPVLNALLLNGFSTLQKNLLKLKSIDLFPNLMMIEKNGKRIFGIWADWILKKGNYGDKSRNFRLKLFKYYLFVIIYFISPFGTLFFFLSYPFRINKIKKNIEFHTTCIE